MPSLVKPSWKAQLLLPAFAKCWTDVRDTSFNSEKNIAM
jgi:hypothetical protein